MVAAFIVFMGGSASLGAAAMTGGQKVHGHCRIVTGEKYLKAPVASSTICAEIERAIAAKAPKASFTADVKVLSPARLAATLVVDGHTLPEHKFAVMDSDLSPEAVQRFARSLAIAASEAAGR
jgi:hypothetical protein